MVPPLGISKGQGFQQPRLALGDSGQGGVGVAEDHCFRRKNGLPLPDPEPQGGVLDVQPEGEILRFRQRLSQMEGRLSRRRVADAVLELRLPGKVGGGPDGPPVVEVRVLPGAGPVLFRRRLGLLVPGPVDPGPDRPGVLQKHMAVPVVKGIVDLIVVQRQLIGAFPKVTHSPEDPVPQREGLVPVAFGVFKDNAVHTSS